MVSLFQKVQEEIAPPSMAQKSSNSYLRMVRPASITDSPMVLISKCSKRIPSNDTSLVGYQNSKADHLLLILFFHRIGHS